MNDMAPVLVLDKDARWFSPLTDAALCAVEEATAVAMTEVELEAPDA